MFQGFSEKTQDFLWGIRLNNERPWFEAHREDFQNDVQLPMKELGDELLDWFGENYPKLLMNLHRSRIYRDARRLFGRGPFKDSLWISFQKGENWAGVPCFYVEIEPEGLGWGMGCYSADGNFSRRFREKIDRDPKAFAALVKRYEAQNAFQLNGEDYKRAKGHADDPLGLWYNKKHWWLSRSIPYDQRCSRQLPEQLKADIHWLMPFYLFVADLAEIAE